MIHRFFQLIGTPAEEELGFIANEVQTESSLQGIRFMFSIFPAILAFIGVIGIYFYRIDSSLIEKMEVELKGRRAAA